jgi:hypothetical protein
MGYLELALLVAGIGVLAVAFGLAWVDAAPRGRAETSFNETTD